MTIRLASPLMLLLLAGCAAEPTGVWALTGSGGTFIEEGISAEAMQDDCAVGFDRFVLVWGGRFIEGSGGVHVAEVPGAQVFDLVPPGPHDLGATEAPVGDHDHLHAVVQPAADAAPGNVDAATVAELGGAGLSMILQGTVTCAGGAVSFDWRFDRATGHHCFADVVIGEGQTATTAYTVAGQRLFQTALQDFDAPLAGQPFVDADADADGEVTLAELDAVDIATPGYDLATWSGVATLADYVTVQTFYFLQTDGSQCVPEIL